MAFWLHEHRVLLVLRYLAPRYKIIAIGIISVAIACLWAFVFFIPARKKLQQELRIQNDLLQQHKAFDLVANKLEMLTHECKKLEAQVNAFDIQPATVHETIDFLVHVVRKHRMLCKNIRPQQKQRNNHEFFKTEYCTLTLVGSFAQMLLFLDEVKLSKRLIAFKTIDLVRGKDNTVKVTVVARIASVLPT